MINDIRVRYALWAAIAHTVVVIAAVWVKNGLYGTLPSLAADRWLRVVDVPVLWLVDPALQNFSLPAKWFYPSLPLALGVHEALAYGLFGGAFYALMFGAFAAVKTRGRMNANGRGITQK
jgi:hypothetical protein